jgi:hypothetical protein
MRTFFLLMFLFFLKKKQEELGLLFKNQYKHVIARIFCEMVDKASLRSEIQTNFTANYTLKK